MIRFSRADPPAWIFAARRSRRRRASDWADEGDGVLFVDLKGGVSGAGAEAEAEAEAGDVVTGVGF